MPFTVDAFFGVFPRYNEATWPTQVFAYLAAVVAVASLRATSPWQAEIITAILAAMWAINGIGYHWIFFTEVNQAAWVFGALFLVKLLRWQDRHIYSRFYGSASGKIRYRS